MADSTNYVSKYGSSVSVRGKPLYEGSVAIELEQFGYSIRTGKCTDDTKHWHDGIEILAIHNGVMELDIGKDSAEMVSGNVAAFTSSEVHATQPCNNEYIRTALHFVPDAADGAHALSLISGIQDQGGFRLFTLDPDAMRRFIWCIIELNTMRNKFNSLIAKHILGLILTDVFASKVFDPSPPVLRNIVEYMKANLDNREQMAEVATRFYISDRHLARLFRTHLGSSPQEYWLRLRINRACEVLRRSEPIKAVADSVGFSSLSGFQRAFKQTIGISPAQYQAQCQDFTAGKH